MCADTSTYCREISWYFAATSLYSATACCKLFSSSCLVTRLARPDTLRVMRAELAVSIVPGNRSTDSELVGRITALLNQVYAVAENGMWSHEAVRTSEHEIASLVTAEELVVAESAAELLGCVRLHAIDEVVWEFGMLASRADHRNLGVGRALVDFAETRARALGAEKMQLQLLVPKSWQHPSKEFLKTWYTRRGYRLTGNGSFEVASPAQARMLATSCDFLTYRKNLLE